jgi:predicted metalloendopeptidase
MRLALRALQATPGFDAHKPLIDGFTPLQRFFLSWGQVRFVHLCIWFGVTML